MKTKPGMQFASLLLVASAIALAAGCSQDGAFRKSNCQGTPKHVKLRIKLDSVGNPERVVTDSFWESDADIIVVCPKAKVDWKQKNNKEFTIKFKNAPPFDWSGQNNKKSTAGSGEHKLSDSIRDRAEYDGYKYTIIVTGSTKELDPIIIVDR
ncbi:MAG TPA: hypothetical protein VGA44_03805 [Steroidobacteraceae bacterium]